MNNISANKPSSFHAELSRIATETKIILKSLTVAKSKGTQENETCHSPEHVIVMVIIIMINIHTGTVLYNDF